MSPRKPRPPAAEGTPDSRRRHLLEAAAALAGSVLASPAVAAAEAESPLNWLPLLRTVVGNAPLLRGQVTLDLPQLADNGNSVAVSVTAAPLPASANAVPAHVKALHLYAEKNPRPRILTLRFHQALPEATIATRIRLAGTQRVLALAEYSDGGFRYAAAEIVVTMASCLDES